MLLHFIFLGESSYLTFFISILSYGNLAGHRENLHFAVQKVFSGKIGGFEACKLL